MKEMLEKTSTEMLREYFYDLRGYYPPKEFTREMLIRILVNNK